MNKINKKILFNSIINKKNRYFCNLNERDIIVLYQQLIIMMNFFTYYKKVLLNFLIVLILAFTACTPQKKLIYLQQKTLNANEQDTTLYTGKSPDYKLRSNDLIYIKINNE